MKIEIKAEKYTEIPIWANEKEIVNCLVFGRMKKNQKDVYTLELLERLFSRIETLESCVDQLVNGA